MMGTREDEEAELDRLVATITSLQTKEEKTKRQKAKELYSLGCWFQRQPEEETRKRWKTFSALLKDKFPSMRRVKSEKDILRQGLIYRMMEGAVSEENKELFTGVALTCMKNFPKHLKNIARTKKWYFKKEEDLLQVPHLQRFLREVFVSALHLARRKLVGQPILRAKFFDQVAKVVTIGSDGVPDWSSLENIASQEQQPQQQQQQQQQQPQPPSQQLQQSQQEQEQEQQPQPRQQEQPQPQQEQQQQPQAEDPTEQTQHQPQQTPSPSKRVRKPPERHAERIIKVGSPRKERIPAELMFSLNCSG